MKIVKLCAILGFLAMTGVITFAFIYGNFAQEGATLLSIPWGIVSLVDLYVGFTLFSMWIIFREKSLTRSLIWVAFMIVLGFFTASIYTFIAAQQSEGDWQRFWFGKRLESNQQQ
jgi:hypothetical protein